MKIKYIINSQNNNSFVQINNSENNIFASHNKLELIQ